MGFKLRKNESASAGIRRVARELIDGAVERIGDRKGDPEEAVHEVRKDLKRFRAVVRLVRGELGDEVFDRENVAARDLGRRLSAVRDSSVRLAALKDLQKAFPGEFPEREITALARRLASRRSAALRSVRRRGVLRAIARELSEMRRGIRTWPLSKPDYSCLEAGLRRSYRQGRKGQAQAYASGADETLHEWRKRAKDLRYHVELLEPLWPETMKDIEKALHDLTDLLGDDHDFADLRRILKSSPGLTRGVPGADRLVELIDRRRSRLQADARPVGARVYGEKPGAFSTRIGAYWDAWRA